MDNEQKKKFRQELANRFIAVLEKDQMEWTKGWQSSEVTSPFNYVTNSYYKGVNRFVLGITALTEGYEDPRWVTMVQIQDKKETYHKVEKWHLKKGSHGTKVEYWFPYDKENKKALTWSEYKTELKSGREMEDFNFFPKYFTVFNASQIEGIEPFQKPENNQNIQADSFIKTLSESMNVPISFDGNGRAYYSPSTDSIHLPQMEDFISSAEFNGTALHELSHASGHPSRLNRKISNGFGSEDYAYEELIAEMSSAFLSVNLKDIDLNSFNRFENNEAYVQSWIQAIKDAPDVLVKAIKEAERASIYMEYQAKIITEEEYKKQQNLDEMLPKPKENPEEKIENSMIKQPGFENKTEVESIKNQPSFYEESVKKSHHFSLRL